MATEEEHALAVLDTIEIVEAAIRDQRVGGGLGLKVHNPALVIYYLAVLAAALVEETYDKPFEHTAQLRAMVAARVRATLN